MNALLQQAQAAAKENKLVDQTEDSGGNFEYEPPAAGPCIGRLVTYMEIGMQKQPPFKGAAKKPSPECIIEFQLLGKKHAKEIEFDVEGVKTKKTIYPIIRLGRGPSAKVGEAVRNGMNMPGGSRSNHYKLLQAMDYGRGYKQMALMIGEAFKLNIVHNEVETEKDGKKSKVVYANLRDANGVWQVSAPLVQKFDEEGNPEGAPQTIKAPEATVPLKLLLWDAPSIEQWDSCFIDGTFTKKVGETEVEVSKNWMQAQAIASTNFEGSGVQSILLESGGDLPPVSSDPEEIDLDDEIPDFAPEADQEPAGTDTPETSEEPAGEAEKKPEANSDDPLAGLDFD